MRNIGILLMVVLSLCFLGGCSGHSWEEYTNEKAGFSAEFPCTPKSSSDFQRLGPSASLKSTTYSCKVGMFGGEHYGFTISEYSNWAAGEVEYDIDKGIQGVRNSLKSAGAAIRSEQDVTLAGFDAHEFVADKDGSRSTLRLFVEEEDIIIYTAEVSKKGNKEAGENGDRFFDSIKLLD